MGRNKPLGGHHGPQTECMHGAPHHVVVAFDFENIVVLGDLLDI